MKKTAVLHFASLLMVFFILIILSSCEYEFIEIDQPDPNVPVKFSEAIIPIFTTNSNCTACHRTGGTSPDLSAANAYNSIVPALINLSDPESSKIYTVPGPASSHASRYTLAQAALVLTWIKQGAENN